jgi:hypothetical protein
MYQVIEKRMLAIIICFACLMIVPMIMQFKGFLSVSRKATQPK